MRNNNNTPEPTETRPVSIEYLYRLEQRVAEKDDEKSLAEKLMKVRFYNETDPCERMHHCLSRSQWLATLLCNIHTEGGEGILPEALHSAAEFMELEIKSVRIILDDFWDRCGRAAWKAHSEDKGGDQ